MFDFSAQLAGTRTKQRFGNSERAYSFGWLTNPGFAFDKSKPKSVPNLMGQGLTPDSVCLRECNFENDQQAALFRADLFMLYKSGLVSHPNFDMRSGTALVK